jgi:hypothetical protein
LDILNIKFEYLNYKMYQPLRENNNVLNPSGAPQSYDGFGDGAYKPTRAGYGSYG